jgi:molecular chaperone DnaK (HSP70)/fido (protein-threonine AMPylation protein)
MSNGDIISLSNRQVPTVVSFDLIQNRLVIGESAKHEGMNNQTNMFDFKMDLGLSDKEFKDTKKYWYGVNKNIISPKEGLQNAQTFSAKEVTKLFLSELLKDIVTPNKLILGIPAVRESTWRSNFRRHMEEVLKELGYADIDFFFEPFAVFQYYRHYENKFPFVAQSEIILVIDIGGGTFNSCIIQTTTDGNLSRGGTNQLPLGLQAEQCGGSSIDSKLLQVIIQKAQKRGIRWKDDPASRAKMPALIRVEEAKICLSNKIGQQANINAKFDHLKEIVTFPIGFLHPEQEIKETITGEDLKTIVKEMWRKHYGDIIITTLTEAEQKLGSKIKKIDRVIVAGGSSKLPFVRDEIEVVLRSKLNKDDIIIGDDLGNAVAYGIACECRELVKQKKYAGLSVGRIAPCLLTDLYICFRKERRGEILFPEIDGENNNGLLFTTPFETHDKSLKYTLDLPFDVNDKLFYYFTKDPVETEDYNFINVTNHVLSIPGKVSRRLELELHIKQNGSVIPTFHFRGKGTESKKVITPITVAEIFLDDLEVQEGEGYLGIDFGTSNSYIAKLMSLTTKDEDIGYPKFEISNIVSERLRETEIEIHRLRKEGLLSFDNITLHANYRKPHMIFHSNKIENIPLTIGETQSAFKLKNSKGLSKAQLEAINHEEAFDWMVENYSALKDEPEGFIRNINKMILKKVEKHPGVYRTIPVTLSGMEYTPPQGFVVPNFMKDLAEEIKQGSNGRSAIEYAAAVHTKMAMIHPFIDGNGRTARLLMNAILLANELPIIVINFTDKQRYLDCIIQANNGNLSDLVNYFLECFRQEVSEIQMHTDANVSLPAPNLHDRSEPHSPNFFYRGDKLKKLIADKIAQQIRVKEQMYDRWVSAFDILLRDVSKYVDQFNASQDIHAVGYVLKINKYDRLTLDKYLDLDAGKNTPRTWFFRLDITDGNKYEKIMLFFQNSSPFVKSQHKASHVSLGIARHDGDQFCRLEFEPINLNEIYFNDGNICGLLAGKEIIDDAMLAIEEYLIADVIDVYIED